MIWCHLVALVYFSLNTDGDYSGDGGCLMYKGSKFRNLKSYMALCLLKAGLVLSARSDE